MRLPDEHPVATYREWAKILIPGLTFFVAVLAAGVALMQLNLAQTSAERQDRAYLFIKNADATYEIGQRPGGEIQFQNFGKTPAFDVKHEGRCRVVSYPSSFGEFVDPFIAKAGFITPPGSSFSSFGSCGSELSQKQIDDLIAGTVAIYFDGRVTYRDAFGKQHVTNYRRVIGGPHPLKGSFMAYSDEGEEAD